MVPCTNFRLFFIAFDSHACVQWTCDQDPSVSRHRLSNYSVSNLLSAAQHRAPPLSSLCSTEHCPFPPCAAFVNSSSWQTSPKVAASTPCSCLAPPPVSVVYTIPASRQPAWARWEAESGFAWIVFAENKEQKCLHSYRIWLILSKKKFVVIF